MNNLFQDPLIEPPNEIGPFINITHPYGEPPVPSKSLMIYLTSAIVAVCYLLASIACCRCYFKHLKKSSTAPEDLPKIEPPPPLPNDYDRYSDMDEEETWKEVWKDISGRRDEPTRNDNRDGTGATREEDGEMNKQEIEQVLNSLRKPEEEVVEERKLEEEDKMERHEDDSSEVSEIPEVCVEYRERRGHAQTSL